MTENFNQNNPTDTTNLANFIDTDNANDPSRYHAQEAPQNAQQAPSEPQAQQPHQHRSEPWTSFCPIPASRYNTFTPQITEGALLEGKLTKAELLNDRNGFPFLKITVALNEPQGWNLSHCHFFPRQKATSTEAVLELTSNYLSKFNYVAGSNDYSQTQCTHTPERREALPRQR